MAWFILFFTFNYQSTHLISQTFQKELYNIIKSKQGKTMGKDTNKGTNKDEVMKVQIFDNVYDYNALSDDTKKLFILQDDIRRDLAFHHARADSALLMIRQNLEKSVTNETPIGPVDKKGDK